MYHVFLPGGTNVMTIIAQAATGIMFWDEKGGSC